MTKETFSARLRDAAVEDLPAIEQLCSEYVGTARQTAIHLAQMATQANPVGSQARIVFSHLEEGTLLALESELTSGGVVSEWHLTELGRGLAAVEQAAVSYLRRALQDRRDVPTPRDNERIEEPEPDHRVCDEAYLQLRRNLSGETEPLLHMESNYFLNLPDPGRDTEIQNYARTGKFSRLVQPVPDDEA